MRRLDHPSASPFRYRDWTIGAAFGDVVERYPARTAVIDSDGEVSYHALATRAGTIAGLVRSELAGTAGGTTGGSVGLLLGHDRDMVSAILGVLAAGRCYVPLDPTYPARRLADMVQQAGTAMIVTRRRHRRLAEMITSGQRLGAAPAIELDELDPLPLAVSPADPRQPAYLLFTSGSTGRPKGVLHSHRSVLHGIDNHVTNLRLGRDDRTSLVAPFNYDMSVSDLYGALLSGGALVLTDIRTLGIARLAYALADHRVTVYHSTPTVFRALVDFLTGGIRPAGRPPEARLPDIRVVLLGGEPTYRTDLRLARTHFGTGCVFVNGYGSTEVSFTVQNHLPVAARPDTAELGTAPDPVSPVPTPDSPASDTGILPIGQPLAGFEVVLLHPDDGTPMAGPGPAELAIRSDYLALGYWRDPALTAERFGTDGKLYRTGDIVRRLPDGQLVHLGRKDRQVKIRGNRIELGEIEAALESLPGVVRAVVVARRDGTRGAELHGFVQPSRWGAPDPVSLRSQLADLLPAHMRPQRLSMVTEFPLTESGKVNLRVLLARPLDAPGPAGPRLPPAGERERLVARVWSDILGVCGINREASFFDLGGTSLTLAQVQYQLAMAAGSDLIPLIRLLEQPTVMGMARLLDGTADPRAGAQITDRVASRRAVRDRRAAEARRL